MTNTSASVASASSTGAGHGPGPASQSSAAAHPKEKFLAQYLASIDSFPTFLQQKLGRIRQLDELCVAKVRALDQFSKQHVANIRAKWSSADTHSKASGANTGNNASTSNNDSKSNVAESGSQSFSSKSESESQSAEPFSQSAAPASSSASTLTNQFGSGSSYDVDRAESFLRSQQDEISRLNRTKISLSAELYDALDVHVRRLDSSLKKYEARLRKGGFEISSAPLDRRRITKRVLDSDARSITMALLSEMRDEIDKNEVQYTASASSDSGALDDGAEMSGAPHSSEPVYCVCRKISYGNMVACDNEDCEIEWFHFACMGLEVKPRGKWYCPDCRKKIVKKGKTK